MTLLFSLFGHGVIFYDTKHDSIASPLPFFITSDLLFTIESHILLISSSSTSFFHDLYPLVLMHGTMQIELNSGDEGCEQEQQCESTEQYSESNHSDSPVQVQYSDTGTESVMVVEQHPDAEGYLVIEQLDVQEVLNEILVIENGFLSLQCHSHLPGLIHMLILCFGLIFLHRGHFVSSLHQSHNNQASSNAFKTRRIHFATFII